jgi:hypothetical protein
MTMTANFITYANATPDQQKQIDAVIAAVGTSKDKIARIGKNESEKLVKLSTKLAAQMNSSTSTAKVARSMNSFLAQPQKIGDVIGNLQHAKVDITKCGKAIEACIEGLNTTYQDLQLLFAVVAEIEHRINVGTPSAPAKYRLKGTDTRSFQVNMKVLTQKVLTTKSAKAQQDATDLTDTRVFVRMKANILAEKLYSLASDIQLVRMVSEENAANSALVTKLEGNLSTCKKALSAKRPRSKASPKRRGPRPA